jgi:hypothetical protein
MRAAGFTPAVRGFENVWFGGGEPRRSPTHGVGDAVYANRTNKINAPIAMTNPAIS